MVFVFQQNHRTGGDFTRGFMVFCFAVSMLFFKSRFRLQNKINDSVNAYVKLFFVKRLVFYGIYDLFGVQFTRGRHFKIRAGFYSRDSVNRGTPVRYNKTFKAPLFSEHLFLKPMVL